MAATDAGILAIIAGVIDREGGKFTQLAADKGGATRWGITQATLTSYRQRHGLPPATVDDVRQLTRELAVQIYLEDYVTGPRFDRIADPWLREQIVDAGVQHDPRRASKWAQAAAEVPQDGVLGEISLRAINAAAPMELFLWVVAFRLRLYGRLVSQDPQLRAAGLAGFNLQAIFAGGWNNRIADFLERKAREIEAQHAGKSTT